MAYLQGIDPTKVYASTDTQFDFAVNTIGIDADGKAYQFVKANGVIAVGDVVAIDEVGDADQVTTTVSAPGTGQGLPCGVGVVALADNEWGWVQRQGVVAAINIATSCAAHTAINSTATVGRLDDDATAGAEVIEGITTTAAESSNSAAGIINWPYIGVTL
ncbi:MAG: hypothetical protein JKY88_09085 [Pseudomonadales bacterium]|nr:hypothetical protein [Pseudomonadales bacterium]